MRIGSVFAVVGLLLRPFAAVLVVPAAIDLADGRTIDAITFLATAAATFAVGHVLARRLPDPRDVGRVEALAVVSLCWFAVAALGAVPYMGQGIGPVDALFESMSGFTTTGSTIFREVHFVELSRGLMFWRSFEQWLGGMGIIAVFVAVFPALAVAGRQMFFAEAPGPEDEALTPRIRHTAGALFKLYAGMTAIEITLLTTVGGMSLFDATCHSFSTLAGGGFSPNPRSLAGYGPGAQWIVTAFMFVSATSFALLYRALRRPSLLLHDTEFRTYVWIALLTGVSVSALIAVPRGHDLEASLRHGFFQTMTMFTATGFASEDFALWPAAALMLIGATMFIGGCAGSAAGGPKVIRMVVLAKFLGREILCALHPRAVRAVRVGGRALPSETLRGVVGFLIAYFATFAVGAVAVAVIENDLTVGITGSITTLGNIGPGFGLRIGPMATFADLSTLSKLIFTAEMWVGRLEVMTVLVLFHPDALRALFGRRAVRRQGAPGAAAPPPSPAPPPTPEESSST
ncbi:MAG TPA: TrkH family potassium uptake protein [Planctomycetota bacterium]|nr:TrkH family potassium uptake protein [Planctomycetota bacterium]